MQVRILRTMAIGTSAAIGLALMVPSARAQAQTSGTRFGVEIALADHSTGLGVGGFGKFHLTEISERAITGRVSLDYYFPSTSDFHGYSFHYFELAGDGLLDIANKNSDIKPYVGGGLTYSNSSYGSGYCDLTGISCRGSGDLGLNVLGGINFMGNSRLMPFAEIKFDLRNGGLFLLKGGIHF